MEEDTLKPEGFWGRWWPWLVMAGMIMASAVAVTLSKATRDGSPFPLIAFPIAVVIVVFELGSAPAFYATMREYNFSKTSALLGALTLGLSPLYINQINHWQSPGPWLGLLMLTAFFYARGLRLGQEAWLLSGSAIALLTATDSPIYVIFPVVFGGWVLCAWKSVKRPMLKAAAIAAIPVAGAAWTLTTTALRDRTGEAPNVAGGAVAAITAHEAMERVFCVIVILGFLLTPMWAGWAGAIWKRVRSLKGLVVFGAWSLVVAEAWWYLSRTGGIHTPATASVLGHFWTAGLGASETLIPGIQGTFMFLAAQFAIMAGIMALGAAGAVCMGAMATLYLIERPGGLFVILPRSMDGEGRARWIAPAGPFLLAGLLMTAAVVISGPEFDKDIVFLIPAGVLTAMMMMREARIWRLAAIAALAAFLAVDVLLLMRG